VVWNESGLSSMALFKAETSIWQMPLCPACTPDSPHQLRAILCCLRPANTCAQLVAATLALYNSLRVELLPTPAKSHYIFNLRDVARVVQVWGCA
jgi:hypothetical protein